MDWYLTIWENSKAHVTPEPLQEKLVENIKSRGGNPLNIYGSWCKKVKKAGIALGGARRVDESIIDFEIDGLTLGFFARDAEWYYSYLQELPSRLELGQEYYKMHGDLHCVCLLPRQKEELLRQMEERLPEIQALEAIEVEKWNNVVDALKDSPNVMLNKTKSKRKISKEVN